MNISHNWLQSFFDDKIPSPKEIKNGLLLHSFEVESSGKGDDVSGDDIIYELDITPNRSIDCLAHYGIAKEVSAIFSIPLKKKYFQEKYTFKSKGSYINTDACGRYTLLHIKDISLTETPEYVKNFLTAIGQKSINPIVDISNYILFSIGQPNHAFDAGKVSSNFGVRYAKEGEKISLLGGDEGDITYLDANDIVITNDDNPVALGGVKGGLSGCVDADTKEIYLEVATFDMSHIRATSRRLGIITDASLRYSQGYRAEMIDYTVKHIVDIFSEFSTVVDSFDDCRARLSKERRTGISVSEVNKLIGSEYTEDHISKIFTRLGFTHSYIDSREKFLELIKEQIGVPYKLGSSVSVDAPDIFDCSSLVSWCASNSGKSLPRISVNQYLSSTATTHPKAGDLIFIPSGDKDFMLKKESIFEEVFPVTPGVIERGINHVGIIIDENTYIHAEGSSGQNKVISSELTDEVRAEALYTSIWEDEKRFVVDIPIERFDIFIGADLIEEIIRISGLDSIASLPPERGGSVVVNPIYAKCLLITNILKDLGLSEIMTYSFSKKGDVCVACPVAEDKGCLRKNLSENMKEALKANSYYGELLGLPRIAIFEIGTVFMKKDGDGGKEELHLCVGVQEVLGRKKTELTEIENEIKKALKLSTDFSGGFKDGVLEVCLDDIYIEADKYVFPASSKNVIYRESSKFPFVLRDIAVFVPLGTPSNVVEECIKNSSGEFFKNITLVDIFEKGNQVSYAFRVVFQSDEKTLDDITIGKHTDAIYSSLKEMGYTIR